MAVIIYSLSPLASSFLHPILRTREFLGRGNTRRREELGLTWSYRGKWYFIEILKTFASLQGEWVDEMAHLCCTGYPKQCFLAEVTHPSRHRNFVNEQYQKEVPTRARTLLVQSVKLSTMWISCQGREPFLHSTLQWWHSFSFFLFCCSFVHFTQAANLSFSNANVEKEKTTPV